MKFTFMFIGSFILFIASIFFLMLAGQNSYKFTCKASQQPKVEAFLIDCTAHNRHGYRDCQFRAQNVFGCGVEKTTAWKMHGDIEIIYKQDF